MHVQTLDLISDRWHSATNAIPLWLFIAAVIHIVLLLGLDFYVPTENIISKSIEITLVNSATKKAPEDAKYLAQENQIGAGTENKRPKPAQQKIPVIGKNTPEQGELASKSTDKIAAHRLITQTQPAKKKALTTQKISNDPILDEPMPDISVTELQQQIMQLGEKIKRLQQSAEKTNIKFVTSISAHKYMAAEYVKNWTQSVERIGNLNYPEIALQKDFTGILSIDVGIKKDGSIYNIQIIQSSGNPELDAAAKRIIRISAPFAPLPVQIAAQLDVLKIRRVWNFADEKLVNSN